MKNSVKKYYRAKVCKEEDGINTSFATCSKEYRLLVNTSQETGLPKPEACRLFLRYLYENPTLAKAAIQHYRDLKEDATATRLKDKFIIDDLALDGL